ncbi:hypothetical protein N7523_003365 [Penicillium sp. IBT 18751x]|nr:hypothetical protein N7523_003365 [Penicillium sp. IBT 18751x]
MAYGNSLTRILPCISGIDSSAILKAGATGLADLVSEDQPGTVLFVYNVALHQAFVLPVARSCAMVLPALGVKWRSVKAK